MAVLSAPVLADLPRTPPMLRRDLLLVAAVGVLAVAVRLQLTLRGGGLLGVGAYDDGVHYAAAASLIHGRLPYRDFLFLQPPGMVLAASPFAALGRLLGDPDGLRLLRLAFMAVGGGNAALVALLLRRWGTAALVTGGVAYAVFFPAVYDERTALLEPVGTFGILLALLLTGRGALAGTRAHVVAGLALGVACGFKIWYVVPAAIVLLAARGGRLRVAAGALVAGLAIYLPFLAAAPKRVWQQVVLDQLGRPRAAGDDFLVRARVLLGVEGAGLHSPAPSGDWPTLTIVLLVLLGLACLVALTTPGARVLVVLLLADGAVVVASPSFYGHYAALTAPIVVLLTGVAVGRLVPLLHARVLQVAAVAVVLAAAVALNAEHDLARVDDRPPAALRATAMRTPGCIVSDDPTLLAVMDVVHRDLDAGCALRPDVGGYSFGPDRVVVDGEPIGRRVNARYQRSLVGYLLDSAAFVRWRPNTGLSAASLARLREQPVIVRAGGFTLRAGTR